MKQKLICFKSSLIFCLLLVLSYPIKASTTLTENLQQKITGTVTIAADGMPLPGVTVLVKGTTTGTTTDFDGKYELNTTSENDVLIFSYVGMKTVEITVNGKSVVNIALEENIGSLDEIVVVGYGSQKRSDVTGSVSSVPEDRLENLPVTNVTQAIQGTTAGLNISQNSSVPGSSGSIQVRGVNSITGSTSPFIVLDGIPFTGTLNDINTRDIKSIQILKDASAVAIYGTRGSNGVILIQTKRGVSGEPIINYSTYVAVEEFANILNPLGPDAYVQKYADFFSQNNPGVTQDRVLENQSEIDNFNAGRTTDWFKEVTQSGIIQEHNLSIRGGSEKVKYFVSGGYLDQQGVIKGYDYEKLTLRSNLDVEITDYLKVGLNTFFANNNFDGGRANLLLATAMSPYSVPYDDNGQLIINPMLPELLYENPLLGLTTDREVRERTLSGNVFAEITPAFLEGLSYRVNASYTINPYSYKTYKGRAANDNRGTAVIGGDEEKVWIVENILKYAKSFGKHNLDFTALYSAQSNDFFREELTGVGFVNDQLSFNRISAAEVLSADPGRNYSTLSTLVSQMGRVNYNYDSKYLVTATVRRDGYSAFGANTSKYGVFPSAALGWNIHKESFMQNADAINNLKLRLSYGKTGNRGVGINQTQTRTGTTVYPFGGQAYTGTFINGLGNPNLQWETTTSGNLGADFGLWNNRINGSVEVYKSKTKDLLLNRSIPALTGTRNIIENIGEVENRGFEFSISSINVNTGDFKWETNLNFSTYKNEILDLYGDGKDDIPSRWFIGKSLGAIYDYRLAGVWQEGEDTGTFNANPGDLKFEDLNGDGVIDPENDRSYLGSSLPEWTGGLTNTFSYKNFDLAIFLQTVQGVLKGNPDLNYGDELARRNTPAEVGYWTPENQSNEFPSLTYRNTLGYGYPKDASFVRLKDIRLSYRFPIEKIEKLGLSDLMIYATGRNLYTWTDWTGWDPESSQSYRGSGDWTNNYPVVRTFSLGLNVSL
ncbi:SusC/RagA family TonB-linked outer membrane protein [Leeuwenhoekiella sp. LLG6367-2.1]|uniref:SusC/RagA family TonB-linked outer membrane protein n=1 Tax=Leeuwenhoekiella sp. LLG6367-2.1 TaxID=3160833 RepID=UPI003870E400